ncbi:MAG: transglycosylase SLT domain-containing protein [Candidatus Thiodiazotropha sp. 6PLUC7]
MKYVFIALLLVGALPTWSGDFPVRADGYLEAIEITEKAHNMPSGLLVNLIRHESNFDPNVVSHKGAVGIAQIVPKWHPEVDPTDPYQSIDYAGKYLGNLKKEFGSWSRAIVAYNWGEGNMRKHGINQAPRESLLLLSQVIQDIF